MQHPSNKIILCVKRFLILFGATVLFSHPSSVLAATYYIDTENGNDANVGTSEENAWRTLDYADEMLTATDTLIITAPKTAPARGGFSPGVAGSSADSRVTLKGESSTQRAYVTGSVNVSQGEAVENLFRNGGAEAWLSASSLWSIPQTAGNLVARSTEKNSGTYAINATRTSASIWLSYKAYVPANTAVSLQYYHKDMATGRWRYAIKDNANNYLQSNGTTWDPAFNIFDPNDANSSWHAVNRDFTTNGEGVYEVQMSLQQNDTVYLDDVSLVYDDLSTYQWEDVPGKNYKALNVPFAQTPAIFAKSTASNWSTNGVEALSFLELAEDLDALDATENEWYYDSTSSTVYYHPPSGEVIANMHFELSQPRTDRNKVEENGLLTLKTNYPLIQNIRLFMANRYGVHNSGTATNVLLEYVHVAGAGYSAFTVSQGQMSCNNCSGNYSYSEDIFSAVSGGTLNCNYCLAEYAMDDGFQSTANSTININYSISRYNGREEAGDNSGFISEGSGASCNLYNVVAYENYGLGISHGGTDAGTCTVKNSIAYGSVLGASNDVKLPITHGTFTHSHNLFGGYGGTWTVDATEIVANPLFTNAAGGDFTLQSTSQAIDAGVDVGLTRDYAGTTVPQNNLPDIGGFEYVFPVVESNPSSGSPRRTTRRVSKPKPPACRNSVPVGAPDLFQIDRSGSTATLHFTPASNSTKNYNVLFGYQEGDEKFGGVGLPSNSPTEGVQTIKVEYLEPHKNYAFKVIPTNGCAVGEWSNWLRADKIDSQSLSQKFYRYFN